MNFYVVLVLALHIWVISTLVQLQAVFSMVRLTPKFTHSLNTKLINEAYCIYSIHFTDNISAIKSPWMQQEGFVNESPAVGRFSHYEVHVTYIILTVASKNEWQYCNEKSGRALECINSTFEAQDLHWLPAVIEMARFHCTLY